MTMIKPTLMWVSLALLAALTGCASPELTTVRGGSGDDQKLLARVVTQTDVQVVKPGVDVPNVITRVHQAAFVNPETGKLIPIPNGNGSTIDVLRAAYFETSDTLLMRTLPSLLTTVGGAWAQSEGAQALAREQARLQAECFKKGTCQQGPSTVVNAVSGSSSQALIDGLTLSLINQIGCADKGTCPNPATPTPQPAPSKEGGGK